MQFINLYISFFLRGLSAEQAKGGVDAGTDQRRHTEVFTRARGDLPGVRELTGKEIAEGEDADGGSAAQLERRFRQGRRAREAAEVLLFLLRLRFPRFSDLDLRCEMEREGREAADAGRPPARLIGDGKEKKEIGSILPLL